MRHGSSFRSDRLLLAPLLADSILSSVSTSSVHRPTVLSAFTGAGGLDLGLECAGFETIGVIERDRVARETIQLNRPGWRILEPYDLLQLAPLLTPEALGLSRGELDILAGGPPCQPFSKAAQWTMRAMAGLRDPRSNCLGALLVLIDRFLPKVVLIENVPGFAAGANSAIPYLETALKAINRTHATRYRLAWRRIDAADYGVPQRRHRAILIAARDGACPEWPTPTHTERPVRAYDAIGDLNSRAAVRANGKWAELLPAIPEGKNYQWLTPEGGGAPLFGRRTKFWSFLLKLAKDQPSWTLSAQPGPATGPFHWDNRPLTPQEMLRLQSFPRSWKLAGSLREQIRQAGNATPPLLAEVIGRVIGAQYFGLEYIGAPKLAIPRRQRVPPPAPTAQVPRRYSELKGPHAPHPGTGLGPRPRNPLKPRRVA